MSVMPVIGGTANDGSDAADARSLLHHQGELLVSLQVSMSKRRWYGLSMATRSSSPIGAPEDAQTCHR
jgi:hypothetical protein